MDARLLFLIVCFIGSPRLSFSASGPVNSLRSVPDLEKLMYTVLDGFPCVRLLNLTGEVGCSNPGRGKVVAPIVEFKKANKLTELAAVLISLEEFESFFARLEGDANFAKHVAGVLVESGNEKDLKGFSPDKKFPESEFALYQDHDYKWNPTGSGIMWKPYNFPVFLLSENATSILQKIAVRNENRKNSYTADVAEFDLVMQTTKSSTRDSESCLQEGTCLPLGGYSVWSALPPINVSSSQESKSIILVTTSMDSSSFFRDRSLGAESPISGLISLLAAVDALSHLSGLNELPKQLVFVVFTGEAWGYLGSRRFLHELERHDDGIDGLDLAMVEMVFEIGSIGKSADDGINSFFAHTSGDTSGTNKTFDALKHAQESLKMESIKISMANTANPGIPPSSLMAFVKKKPEASGIVLEDFDSAFTNKFYHSHLDDISNVNSSVIAAAASLVARTLYILATDKKQLNVDALSTINVNTSLVEELLGCLLKCDPGLQCELVKNYIASSTTCPSHYAGVLQGEPSFEPYPGYILDVPRFVWNFLADKTSQPSRNMSSSCPKDCSGAGEVCIRVETDGKGACVFSSTRYFPAYSTRLKYESGNWKVLPHNSSDVMGEADPVWTESNWDTIRLRVYMMQDSAYDHLILLLGIAVTVLTYLVIVIVRAFIEKALKQD